MTNKYALRGNQVLYLGTEHLSLENVRTFVSFAMRRKMRRNHEDDYVIDTLHAYGEAHYAWNFSRSRDWHEHTKAGFVFHKVDDDSYGIECTGIERVNEYVVERVNRALAYIDERNATSEAHKAIARERAAAKRAQRSRAKKRKAEKLKQAQAIRVVPQVRTGKRRRAQRVQDTPTRQEKLTPQFRNQRLFWDEAIKATMHIFEVRSDMKYTARQVVGRRLHASLKKSGGKFAKYTHGGFTLRFDLIDGIWRGDITPLLISATKDNEHPLYRRMRHYFRDRFIHAGVTSKKQRKLRLAAALELPPNVIMWHGIRYTDRQVA